jgi:replication factor C subunit 3/5
MNTVMQFVAKRAGFDLPPDAADKIVEDSGGNLRKAILVLEALKMQSYELSCYFCRVLFIYFHCLDQI